jgi:hypothetical protein
MNNKNHSRPLKEKIKELKKAIGKLLNPGKQPALILQPLRVKKKI